MAQPTYTKVGSRPAHRESTKRFLGIMSDVGHREGWREAEAFRKWLTAARCAIAGPTFRLRFDPAGAAKSEALYMEIVASARHPKETMDDFAHAMGVVIEALEAEQSDFLSPIFTELSAYSEAGQFFTPWHVCRMMAELIIGDPRAMLDEARAQGRSAIWISEPAVGCGAMALAAAEVLKSRGINPASQAHFVCQDVDVHCFDAAYIQLSLSGVSADLHHGNTLSADPPWLSLRTLMAAYYPKRSAPIPANQPGPYPARPIDPPPTASPEPGAFQIELPF